MTSIIQQIKKIVKTLPCLGILDPQANLIVENDASIIGYGEFSNKYFPTLQKNK